MKTIKLFVFAVVMTAISGVGFAQTLKTKNNTDDSKIGLQGYSPVSYLDLQSAQKGLKEFKATHDGVAYYFTSKAQENKFKENPEKYLPQYGGFCAFGVSVGAKFRVDPNKFVVKDGKYFLFLNDLEVDARQLWVEGNHEKLVSKADGNWAKLIKEN